MATSYDTSWDQASSPFARKPTQRPSSMYSDPSQQTADQSAGMYSQPVAPVGGGFGSIDFSNLQAGGTQDVTSGDTSIRNTGPDQTGMYNAYTGLLGTGLQTEAQKAVANTNIQPAMTKLGIQQLEYFPFLKQLISANGLGGGNSGMSSLISGISNSANPAYQHAAINAAEADSKRAQEQGVLNQYGQLGSANSPQAVAARQMAAASQAGGFQDAKRKIEDDYAQRRVGNLATAISAQNSSMNPLYSLFGSLLS